MSMIRPLVDTLTFNDTIVTIATADLDDRVARRRLRGDGGSSIAWTLGHALQHRAQVARLMDRELPLDGLDVDRFSSRTPATDGDDYPTLQALLAAWTNTSTALIPAMRAVTDADLLQKKPGLKLPHGEQRLLDAFVFYVWHEVYHVGHIGVLRSHFGLTPVANLVMAAQAREPSQVVA